MPWETKVIGASGRWVRRNRALSGKDRCLTFRYHAWDPSPSLEMDPSSHRSGRPGDSGASVRIPMSSSSLTTARPAKKRSMTWTGWPELLPQHFLRQKLRSSEPRAIGPGSPLPVTSKPMLVPFPPLPWQWLGSLPPPEPPSLWLRRWSVWPPVSAIATP